MTTTVTIDAHCDPKTTRVRICTKDDINPQPDVLLEDGESHQVVVFDNRMINVMEIPKE